MAKIIVRRDGQIEQQVQLCKESVAIGRHPHNDIVLSHPTVSADHALIVTILDDSFLEDLHSTNGTYVNGHRIGKHFLQHQDVIKVAKYQLEFLADGIRPLAAAALRSARLTMLNGPHAGQQMALNKPLSTLGRAGVPVLAIARDGDAYRITVQSEGGGALLNGQLLDRQGRALVDGDEIELAGTRMAFQLLAPAD